MTEPGASSQASPITGQMFLYASPELLNREQHESLGFTPSPAPYAFASKVRAIPLVMSEIVSAQHHYPVVFTDLDDPAPIAIVGLEEDVNLFVDADGRWDEDAYVPAYLRCHPFALATAPDQRFAVVIDRSSPSIVENGQYPLFDGEQLSSQTQQMVDFCAKYEGERRKTQQYVQRLKELELLDLRRATMQPQDGEEQTIARYISVAPEKVGQLTAEQVYELHQAGMLAATFAHLFSLENWARLVGRRKRRAAAG